MLTYLPSKHTHASMGRGEGARCGAAADGRGVRRGGGVWRADAAAAGIHVEFISTSELDCRAHGLSHAAASLRCEEKALKDETSAVGCVP